VCVRVTASSSHSAPRGNIDPPAPQYGSGLEAGDRWCVCGDLARSLRGQRRGASRARDARKRWPVPLDALKEHALDLN
jgi:uncharacterized protein (DUF2237 family)